MTAEQVAKAVEQSYLTYESAEISGTQFIAAVRDVLRAWRAS